MDLPWVTKKPINGLFKDLYLGFMRNQKQAMIPRKVAPPLTNTKIKSCPKIE